MRSRAAWLEGDLGRGELALELLHGARADDRRRDRGVVDHERDRQLDHRQAGVLGDLGQLLDRLELALVLGQRHVVARGQPLARGRRRRAVGGPAARQPAARERAVGEDAHAVALRGRQDVELDLAHEHRVRRLLGAEPLQAALARGPLRLDDLPGRERRRADGADLALLDEVGERAERLLDVGVGVGAVDLVEVDPVGAEPAERVLDLGHDPAPREAPAVRVLAHRPHTLVASTTSSRRPRSALPTISSDSPAE